MTKLSMYYQLWLYAALAVCVFSQTTFGGDEAAKYLTPVILFWLKYSFGCIGAGLLAIKMFTSTAYSDYMAKQKSDDNTKFLQAKDLGKVNT